MDGEQIGFFHGARIDALLRLDRRQRGEPIAVKAAVSNSSSAEAFSISPASSCFTGRLRPDRKSFASRDQFGIAGKIDLARAGAGAALDLVEQAGPRAAFEKRIRAGADQEGALERGDGAVDRAGRGEGSEILSGPRLRAAVLEDLRRPVIARDQDVGKRLVVAQLHVETRAQLLDQICLKQQRFGFGRGRHDLDRDGRRDHAQDARRLRRVGAGIGGEPLADVLGLADIEHVVGGIEHAVDAGRGRRQLAPRFRSRHARSQAGRRRWSRCRLR